MDQLQTRERERAELHTGPRSGLDELHEDRPDAPTEHDARVIHHYTTCTEDFYLRDHHDEHIHFGYWDAADVAGACQHIDRSVALPAALRRLIEVVVTPLRIQRDQLVVDAGCGVGGTARFLAREHGCNVIGLDCTPSQIALAKRKTESGPPAARIEYRVADVTKPWAVEPGSVDAVINIDNALYYQRRRRFFAEVTKALRPGGRLALTDWMRVDPMTAAEYVEHINPICQHWFAWNLESLASYQECIESAGLRMLEAEDLAEHVLPTAHQLVRQRVAYEETGQPEYATWVRVLADAWLSGRFTIGRLLAEKPR